MGWLLWYRQSDTVCVVFLFLFSVQPSAVIDPPSIIYQAQEIVYITCHVSGFPSPSVLWYKDGFLVEFSERVNIEQNSLVIGDAQLSDAGKYECAAWNIAGQSRATAELVYTGIYTSCIHCHENLHNSLLGVLLMNTPPLLFEFSGALIRTSQNTIDIFIQWHANQWQGIQQITSLLCPSTFESHIMANRIIITSLLIDFEGHTQKYWHKVIAMYSEVHTKMIEGWYSSAWSLASEVKKKFVMWHVCPNEVSFPFLVASFQLCFPENFVVTKFLICVWMKFTCWTTVIVNFFCAFSPFLSFAIWIS